VAKKVRSGMDGHGWQTQLARLPRERTALLPALHLAQETEHYVSDEAIRTIAAHLRVTANEIEGVATAYPELRRTAPPARVVRICTGAACLCAGAAELLARLERERAASADPGAIEVHEMPCAFVCAAAPVVEAGGRVYGRMTPGRAAAGAGGAS
jgi:formate dehydrogenase subunit gamma